MLGALVAITVGRGEVASYISALFIVYIILIFIRILLSWVPRMPLNPIIRAIVGFVHEVTDPYLNIFRRMLPPVGMGGMALDLGPMVGVIVLLVAQAVVVGSVRG
mgnify:FL=1